MNGFIEIIEDSDPESLIRMVRELRWDRRQKRSQADALANAAASGDVETFHRFAYPYPDVNMDWRRALRRIAALRTVGPEIKSAFLTAWIEHKHLPKIVGDDRVLVAALRVLFPCDYAGAPIQVYRGTNYGKGRRIHGFSWTRDIEIARDFARRQAIPNLGSQGVVLSSVARPEAVLLIREAEGYYDEGEIVLDPYRIGRVRRIEMLRS